MRFWNWLKRFSPHERERDKVVTEHHWARLADTQQRLQEIEADLRLERLADQEYWGRDDVD